MKMTAVILSAVFCLLLVAESRLESLDATTNNAFTFVLNRTYFNFPEDSSEIEYDVETSSQWVTFVQKRQDLVSGGVVPAILYGTPSSVGSTTVQITAYCSAAVSSSSKTLVIDVKEGKLPTQLYILQLKSTDIYTFVNPSVSQKFQTLLKTLWLSPEQSESDISFVQYFTYDDKLTHLSPPQTIGSLPIEGMYVAAGLSNGNGSACDDRLQALPDEQGELGSKSDIDWCSFKEFIFQPVTDRIIQLPPDSEYVPDEKPTEDEMDQLDAFLKTVVALLVVAIVLLLLLAYVMCGRRKKNYTELGDVTDGSEIIVNKKAIQGASTKLRKIPVQPDWDAFVFRGNRGKVTPKPEPVASDKKRMLHLDSDDEDVDKPEALAFAKKAGMMSSEEDLDTKDIPQYRSAPQYSSAESTLEKKPPLSGRQPPRQPPPYARPPLFPSDGTGGTVSPSMVDAHVSPDQSQARHRPAASHSASTSGVTESDLGPAPTYMKPPAFGNEEKIIESEAQDV